MSEHEIVTIAHIADLKPGDVVTEAMAGDPGSAWIVKVRRPVQAEPKRYPLQFKEIQVSQLRTGDVFMPRAGKLLLQVTSMTKLEAAGIRVVTRPYSNRTIPAVGQVMGTDVKVMLAAESAFIPPGWTPPRDCPRCSLRWTNWNDCTCFMSCGRPLDCNGLRG